MRDEEPPLALYPCLDMPAATKVAMMVSSMGRASHQSMMMPVLLSIPISVRRAAKLVQPDVLLSRRGVRV